MMKEMKIFWPSMLTFLCLSSGFVGIIFSFQGKYDYSLVLLLVALGFDGLDGKLARYLNCASPFGAKLDDFADIIAFVLLPGYCIYHFFYDLVGSDSSIKIIAVLISLIFIIPGFIRLARLNVYLTKPNSLKSFIGLPQAPIGIIIISTIHLLTSYNSLSNMLAMSVLVTIEIIGAILMVSTIKFSRFPTISIVKLITIIFGLVMIGIGTFSLANTNILIFCITLFSFAYIMSPLVSILLFRFSHKGN